MIIRAHVQKVLRDAYLKYVSDIFTFESNSSDPDSPKPKKIKKFWSIIKSFKNDGFGITSLRENGILKTEIDTGGYYTNGITIG